MRAPVPCSPIHENSPRLRPGAAGCGVQSIVTRKPVADSSAQVMCGHSAAGAEWMNTTPRVDTRRVATDILASLVCKGRLPQRRRTQSSEAADDVCRPAGSEGALRAAVCRLTSELVNRVPHHAAWAPRTPRG